MQEFTSNDGFLCSNRGDLFLLELVKQSTLSTIRQKCSVGLVLDNFKEVDDKFRASQHRLLEVFHCPT